MNRCFWRISLKLPVGGRAAIWLDILVAEPRWHHWVLHVQGDVGKGFNDMLLESVEAPFDVFEAVIMILDIAVVP